jgi:outer membrane protein W
MKFKILTLALLFISINLSAQGFLGAISYSTALGMGNTGDYIDNFSYKGFQFEGRSFTNRNWTFGGTFGWNVFDQKITDMIHIEEGDKVSDIDGTQVRYINSFPMMVNGHYYFLKRRSPVRPFLGLNVGVYYITQRFELGVFQIERDNWHFGFAPEAGVLIPIGNMAIMANAKYNYAFSAGQSVTGSTDNTQAYMSFNIGLVFMGY